MSAEPTNPRLWVLGRAAALGVGAVREKVRPSPARTAADVPGTAADITPEWLTAVLCRDTPGAEVVSFSSPGGSSGTSERVALRVAYNQAGRDAGLPEELFAKLSASFTQRLLLGAVDVIGGETGRPPCRAAGATTSPTWSAPPASRRTAASGTASCWSSTFERLGEHGGKPPAFDEAWLIYRQQLFYPYSAWAFTIGRAFYQPKMQPDDRSLAILKRLSAAIDENKSFDALGI